MPKQMMNEELMEYMVWIVEIASIEFFGGDKTLAYNALNSYGIWEFHIENYDVTHTLGADYIKQEMKEMLIAKGENLG